MKIYRLLLLFFVILQISPARMYLDWEGYLARAGQTRVQARQLPSHWAGWGPLLQPGQLCEVELQPGGSCWLAVLRLQCGPLLELAVVQVEGEQAKLDLGPHWLDTRISSVYRVGHSGANLRPPCGPAPAPPCWYAWWAGAGLAASHPPLTTSLPAGTGLSPQAGLQAGAKLELRDQSLPGTAWPVTVTSNRAGLLGLHWVVPGPAPTSLCPDLTLPCRYPALLPSGTAAATPGVSLAPPPALLSSLDHPEQEWTELRERLCAEGVGAPPSPGSLTPPCPPQHKFEERLLLAVVCPASQDRFRVGIVEQVLDSAFFLVSLLEQPELKLTCNGDSDHIVPIAWAIEHKFLEKASLQNIACSPLSKIAGRTLFGWLGRGAPTLETGQLLEFCENWDTQQFCVAEIKGIHGHILTLELHSTAGRRTVLASHRDLRLFPPGFSQENSFRFSFPLELKHCTKNFNISVDPMVTEVEFEVKNEVKVESNSEIIQNEEEKAKDCKQENGFDQEMQEASTATVKMSRQESSWCPPIFFNHLCYSASFLSKHRLEQLPRYIGAGPVRLVMREVLQRLIGSSFKSGAVLKKLEVGQRRRPGYWCELMKGKSRVLLLQGEVRNIF